MERLTLANRHRNSTKKLSYLNKTTGFFMAAAILLSSCETLQQVGNPNSATNDAFARVFDSTKNIQNDDTKHPENTKPVEPNTSSKAKLFPATGPRVGKAEYVADAAGGGGFNVNFSEADLAEVAQTILGDLLDQPFIIDPRVQGKVTVSTGGPVNRGALLSLLETVLSMNSAAMVQSGDTWRIAPAGEVFAGGQTRFAGAGRPGYGVTLIPLKYISATSMIAVLENTVTRAGTLKPDLVRNMLLVSGTGTERANALAAVRAFDVDWMAGMSSGIFPLQNSSADDLIEELEIVLQTGTGGGLEGAVQLQAIERINAVLVLAPSNEMMDKARTWIERLDTGGPSDVALKTYKIDNGKALETADLLNQLFGGAVSSRSSSVNPDARQTTNTSRNATSARNAPRRPRTSNTARRPASGGKVVEGAPRIIGDPINNTLLVLATPQGHQVVAKALREIDNPPAQVLIDMVIAEVTLNDTLRYGVQYFFTTQGVGGVGDAGRGGFSNGSDLTANGVFPGFNFLLNDGTDARFALDILDSITDLKVVSSPHIVAIDNTPAHLQVGDQVPIITRQTQGVAITNAPQVNSVSFRDTGVILNVTPRISSTGLVTMEIEQEVSNVSTTASTGQLTPTISKRVIKSTVAARSGQTILLGGLISDEQQNSTTGLPGLSRIPIIKDMFGGHNIVSKRTELLVFLTPRVLNVDTDMSSLIEEMKERMVLINREAQRGQPDGN
ncbi:Type IV pilus biogenesis protein PilQ [hydrothermal vent metagenome]|uniref:Type IV pilus biogenesis protein PilQ n=1 Tax=hydrothermal vent metagenome TaxID=652676 RepID=A0A3B0RL06_9ZZZZ